MNTKKKLAFYFISVVFFAAISIVVCLGLYGLYLKLDYSFEIGPQFNRFDDELGWTLTPNATSFIKGSSFLNQTVYFDSTVFIEEHGFRSARDKRSAEPGNIMAIGDSWTFGYCVDYEETYPYFLEKELNTPVINMGVPAYGSGSTYGLLKRHVKKFKPPFVVYLTIGLFERSSAAVRTMNEQNELSQSLLIPTFIYNKETNTTSLVYPKPEFVSESVSKGLYPGGSLTAGYSLWNYLWYVKIKQIHNVFSQKLRAFRSSVLAENSIESQSASDNSNLFALSNIAVKQHELALYLDLARRFNFKFVLVEGPHGSSYSNIIEELDSNDLEHLIYIGPEEFQREVYEKSELLEMTDSEKRVPKDGHFGRGTNLLIGKLVASKISDPSFDEL
tara:strand:+ start:818 stop:1984 length:1167 start_codon:yes stop_codon:yes gene_type:complete